MNLASTNPSKGYELIGKVVVSSPDEVRAKVAAAHSAKKAWRELGVNGRVSILRKVTDRIQENKEKIAQLESLEMGMPITAALEDVDYALDFFTSYLDHADEYLKPETTLETDTELHQVFREPYGVAACIVPWNFPLNNFVWQCAEVLIAGNTVVFKHSEEVPLFGKFLEQMLNKILPDGVFNEVYGDGSVGEVLVNQDVNLICFTGSSKTGAKINALAAPRFIHTSMELGGSSPGIVFEDADIDAIKDTVFAVRFAACGQMCDALKRLIIHESKFEETVDKLTKLLATKKAGDAQDQKTDIGPLVAKRQLDLLEAQVADAVEKGAKIIFGGKRPPGLKGAYYEPTLLTGIKPEMRVWQEEVFGPVLPVVAFKDEAQAIRMANHTQYGLGAYIFTEDKDRFARVAANLESGMVSQNNLSYVNVCNPFTGYKMSGGGAEHSRFGFEEVTQLKVVAKEK